MGKVKRWAMLILVLAGLLFVLGVSVQQCEALGKTGNDLESGSEGELQQEDELSFMDEDEENAEDEDDRIDADDEEEVGDAFDFDDSFENEEGIDVEDEENTEFDEKDVVVLGSGNFSEFVRSRHYVLVEFYAPWCGHCQALAPEFAEAATILKGEAVLAKVDATMYDELAQEYGVEGYPTLFFFIDGTHKIYSGHRRKDEIVSWVKKKTGPSVSTLNSKRDAEEVVDSETTIAVALVESLEGPEVEEFASAARQEDVVLFFQTDRTEVAEVFNFPKEIKRPALVLIKQEPEKISWFDGSFKRDVIAAFVAKNKLPLVITFTKETSALIFESPIKKQVILFAGASDYEKLLPAFKEASKSLMGKLVFVHVDLEDSEQSPGIIEFFGISSDKPTIMGYVAEENGDKFLLEGEITVESVKAFGNNFLSNDLQPHLKSDPIPETNDGDVKIVVGLNLDDIVLDESKDVFLEIYTPWCQHCQALEPTWNKLARRLRGVESIVIAKMDGTSNEHARAKPDGYPTLLFYPAGKKSFDPITFDGDRTVKEFVKFLKKEAAIPFTVPRKPDGQMTTTKPQGATDSEPESASKSAEPCLMSVVDDNLNSPKDEL